MRRMTLALGVAIAIAPSTGACSAPRRARRRSTANASPPGKFGSIPLKTEKANTLSVGFVALAPLT